MKKLKKLTNKPRFYRFMTIETRKSRLSDSTDQLISEKILNEYLKAFDPDQVQSFGDWLSIRHEGAVYLWRPEVTFFKQLPEAE